MTSVRSSNSESSKTTGGKSRSKQKVFSAQKQLDDNNRLRGSYLGSLSSYLYCKKRNNKVKLKLSKLAY